MDHDDDVEHLFSWLQTPELRYREFAGAREITDAVIAQVRPSPAEIHAPPPGNTQLQEEYPANQFPDQRDAPEDVVIGPPERTAAPPMPPPAVSAPVMPPPVPPIPPMPRPPVPEAPAPFALGAGGRSALRRPQYEEPVVSPPLETAAARPMAPPLPPPPPAPAAATAAPPPAFARPAPAGGGLLGGAYRENGVDGHATEPPASAPDAAAARTEHSLDAVFGRLAGGRHRPAADPRERLRHIPGLGPPPSRSR